MSATFGNNLKVTIFGESHSAGIGVVIDGLPAGLKIDEKKIAEAMKRRAPNRSVASTKRQEADIPEIVSGYFNGRATGTPLTALIRNTDTRSQDYERTVELLRPGHADYTGFVKYHGFNDYRGGGHFSGRLTAPIVFAGSIARQLLEQHHIYISARIKQIADVMDPGPYSAAEMEETERKDFPVVDTDIGRKMQDKIREAHSKADSVGGVIECAISGLPAGLGDPFFDSVESTLAHIMFSIPAVKGLEFGDGFKIAGMRGSEANDTPILKNGTVSFASNHSGGIGGGITNGMPVLFRVAVRPTASIAQEQKTVNIRTMEEASLRIHGRHDACIVPRAVEAVKCAAALAAADLWLEVNHD